MAKLGAFTFVLHSHLPYCRRAGQWPHGEEWLHEAATETYLPLLQTLYDLRSEGCPFRLTIGITPVLAEQLTDPLVLDHLEFFLQDKIDRAQADIERYREIDPHRASLAQFYAQWHRELLHSFRFRFERDIVGSFRRLQDEGFIEIITSAATHGYLPLLQRDSSLYGQLAVGVQSYRRHFGRAPRAIWLPECAYRPPYYLQDGAIKRLKPGIESFLAELNIGCFFSESHTIEGGEPVGKARGDAIGPYGDIPRRYVVSLPSYREPTHLSTYQPYWVQSAQVAVIGRNKRTGLQVWSADHGYPGDFDYREFHKKDGQSGLQYWRVTGPRADLADKDYYHPDWAEGRVKQHSEHFARLVEDLIHDYFLKHKRFGIIAAAYDTELFGHWWFEGVAWLKEVLRRLAVQSEVVELTTASAFLEGHPPEDILALPEGSWGQAGNHFTWLNVDTEWMWPAVHNAELRMEGLVRRYPEASGSLRAVLNQAARELLLLQSSDWPFLITTGQAREYAVERFGGHLDRFNRLASLAESGDAEGMGMSLAEELFELDAIFPDLDYRVFREREPGH